MQKIHNSNADRQRAYRERKAVQRLIKNHWAQTEAQALKFLVSGFVPRGQPNKQSM